MMRFCLNPGVSGNYAFFDPESTLHVTRDHPVDFADRVTSGIQRGLKSKRILQLDEEKTTTAQTVPVIESVSVPEINPVKIENESIAEPIEEQKEEEIIEVQEEEPAAETKKKGRKKTSEENE